MLALPFLLAESASKVARNLLSFCGYLLTRNDLYLLNPVAQRILCERLLRMLETNKLINCPEKHPTVFFLSQCMRNTSPILVN